MIAELMSHPLSVHSLPGRGCTFVVTLPLGNGAVPADGAGDGGGEE
jgi:signal transduction histidine kinase